LGLELKIQSPIPKTIQSEPTRLKQILMNLVSNAIKFTHHGQVTLAIRMDSEDRSQICFDVIDTGIGIQEERFTKLFQPFEQADASTTRKFGGTGLGLRISKRLSEILGGNIDVTSDVGVGSCFSVRIPTGSLQGVPWIPNEMNNAPRNERRIDPPKTTSLQNRSQSLNGLRVLLVEDGLDNQKLLSFLLRKAGATVNIVGDGKQAVELLCIDGSLDGELHSHAQFDIVLMDMQMPQMDGYQATKLLRSKGYRLPILALTAHAMDSERTKCLAAGCDAWLTKPIEATQLISACYEWGVPAKQVV
jgi:Amt family ammonium transporter